MALSALAQNTAVGKSALITGITGQDGFYLAELLLSKGYEVFGLLRGQNNPKAAALTRELPALKLVSGDLLDASGLIRATVLAHSWANPRLVADVNGGGVLNMLEAIRFYQDLSGKQVRFYQASTSEMFGKVQDSVQSEKTLLWPRPPYGVAKAYGHHLTINYRESYGMHASSGILFNHESPRRGFEFVTRKVSHGVARISLDCRTPSRWAYCRPNATGASQANYVEAMYLMLQQDQGDDYVIATGDTHSIIEPLDAAFSVVGISDWARYVKIDPAFGRGAPRHQARSIQGLGL